MYHYLCVLLAMMRDLETCKDAEGGMVHVTAGGIGSSLYFQSL